MFSFLDKQCQHVFVVPLMRKKEEKKTNTCACRRMATVLILEPFLFVLFSFFWNSKAPFKYIYTFNGVHV